MKKQVKWWLAVLALCFAGMQFFRPAITHPPVTGDLQAPVAVKHILERACYDCHSNTTNLRWYDQVVPAYYLVADHVAKGRKALNFSHWDSLAPADQKAALYLALNQVLFQTMPPASYTTIHAAAKLSTADIDTLKDYLLTLQAKPGPAPAVALDKVENVAPSLNGIQYISGYTDWQVVNTTDRFDNGTMRVIYGNDVAIKAIQAHQTNPWPEGTVFAKVAWAQDTDSSGSTQPGAFKQVEFMIKQDKKWGWARWKGPHLQPYGKTASFANECISCHQPMKDKDLVFTIPDTTIAGRIVNTIIDRKNNQTTAIYQLRDSTYYILKRFEREDPNWFGARIPGKVISREKATFVANQHRLSVP